MKIIALITARANSKRIKGKNTKKLLGQPLVTWTIKTAKKIKEVSDIGMSTDDEKIIKICKKFNILVPWKRPKKLSNSKTTSEEVVIHFLNWYEKKKGKVDGLMLLQPTSPFRKIESIKKAIRIYKKDMNKSVVSFSPTNKKRTNSVFYFNKRKNNISKNKKSLDLLKLNGSIYLSSPKNIRKYKSFLKPKVEPLIQYSKKEAIDIDTKEDWEKAETIMK